MRTTTTTTIMILMTALAASPTWAEDDNFVVVGTIQAEGTGQVWSYGHGEVTYTMSGEGKLVVNNVLTNKVAADGTGTRTLEDEMATFTGFKGKVTVEGATMSAHFSGGRIAFEGRGRGRFVLAGQGKYWVNGEGPFDWSEFGSTVAMGTFKESDPLRSQIEDAEYEAQTAGAIVGIQDFPYYSVWADEYPVAASVFVRTGSFYGWTRLFPSAWVSLYSYPGWAIWLSGRPRLHWFVGYHHGYVTWYSGYPTYADYLWHPYAYYCWQTSYPVAYSSINVYVYDDWCRRFPAAHRALHRHRGHRSTRHRNWGRGDRDRGSHGDWVRVQQGHRFDFNHDGRINAAEIKQARGRMGTDRGRSAGGRVVRANREGTRPRVREQAVFENRSVATGARTSQARTFFTAGRNKAEGTTANRARNLFTATTHQAKNATTGGFGRERLQIGSRSLFDLKNNDRPAVTESQPSRSTFTGRFRSNSNTASRPDREGIRASIRNRFEIKRDTQPRVTETRQASRTRNLFASRFHSNNNTATRTNRGETRTSAGHVFRINRASQPAVTETRQAPRSASGTRFWSGNATSRPNRQETRARITSRPNAGTVSSVNTAQIWQSRAPGRTGSGWTQSAPRVASGTRSTGRSGGPWQRSRKK